MTVLNDLDRFHLAIDVLDRVPWLRIVGAYAKRALQQKLILHRLHVEATGEDLPEVQNWRWPGEAAGQAGRGE